MSSVVNKGGTRFAPKIRQRRTATSVPPVVNVPTSKPIISKDINVGAKETIFTDVADEAATQVATQPSTKDLEDNEDPLSKASYDVDHKNILTKAKDDMNDNAATQVENNDNDKQESTSLLGLSGKPQRRFSRLPSLSGNMGSQLLKPTSSAHNNSNRRLSTIAKAVKRKNVSMNKLLSENEDDATLNAIKKRRLSRTAPPATRKGRNAKKISVVSKIAVPMESTSDDDEANEKKDNSNEDTTTDLVPNDGEYFETYFVRSLEEVPSDVTITDSARYLVDDENFTMDQLCGRTLPIGQISENYDKARKAEKQRLIKRKERRTLRKRAKEEFRSLKSLNKEEEELEREERKKNREKLLNADIPESGPPRGQQMQLKIGADGKMILDEESTVVDRHKNANLENAQKEKVDENPFENLYNNASYGKAQYSDPWKLDEVIKLYKALAMWGTDFNLISQMFPYRTRRQVKAKFSNEERKHPIMIELALRAKLPASFDSYCADIRKELGTIDDFNKKVEQLQVDHEKNIQEIEKAKESAKLEDMNNQKEGDLDKKSSGGFRQKYLNTYRKSEVVLGTIDDVKKLRKINDESIKEEGEHEEKEDDNEEEHEEETGIDDEKKDDDERKEEDYDRIEKGTEETIEEKTSEND